MKKKLIVALSSTLAVAMALPAFAKDHSINGYYRARFITANLSKKDDADPDRLVDQRFRAKWTMGLNEYVSLTYFGEVDMQYGDASYSTSRNLGGGWGGDSVNLETKNLYLDVKIPDTPVSARLGLQGFGDNWDAVLTASDMAGLKLGGDFGMVKVTAGWFKLQEGLLREGAAAPTAKSTPAVGGVSAEDDIDLWALQLGFKPMDNLSVGVDGYYFNANAGGFGFPNSADVYYVGANAAYKADMFDVKGWFAYNFGTVKDGAGSDDLDISGFAASAKVNFSVAGAKLGLRGIFFSSDDDAGDSDAENFVSPNTAEQFSFYSDNLLIFVNDAYWNSYGQFGYAMTDAAYAGWGLWGVTLSGSYVPPMMKQVYVKGGLGYFAALEDDRKTEEREGKSLGTEVALRVGYKLAEVVDLSLNGAYAFLGDFYDKSDAGKDPDDLYELYAMVNVSY
ncbi:hypothetical protein [Deferrisoma palaeochoriense]